MTGVGYDVAADGVDGVAEEYVWLGHYLVCDDCCCVEGAGEAN